MLSLNTEEDFTMKNNWKKIAAMALTLSIGISAIAAPVSAKWVQENNGKWWYYDSNPKNGFKKIDGVWYYFDRNGYMKKGWIQDGANWYYMDGSGKMVTGWKWISGKCYYFYSSGAMASDTIVENSYVNSSGAWVNGTNKSYAENSSVPDFGAFFGVEVAQKTEKDGSMFYGYIDKNATFNKRGEYYEKLLKEKGFTLKEKEQRKATYVKSVNGSALYVLLSTDETGHVYSVYFFDIPDFYGEASGNSNSSSGTTSNGVTYYSGFPTIPDYGAYLGVKTMLHKADESTDSYAYIGTKSSLKKYNDFLLDLGFVKSTSVTEDGVDMALYHYNGSEKAVLGTSYDSKTGTIIISCFID